MRIELRQHFENKGNIDVHKNFWFWDSLNIKYLGG